MKRILMFLLIGSVILSACQSAQTTESQQALSTSSASEANLPVAIPLSGLAAAELTVRTGPGENYPATEYQIGMDQGAAVIGKNKSADWLLVEFGQTMGWIPASQVQLSAPIETIPIAPSP